MQGFVIFQLPRFILAIIFLSFASTFGKFFRLIQFATTKQTNVTKTLAALDDSFFLLRRLV